MSVGYEDDNDDFDGAEHGSDPTPHNADEPEFVSRLREQGVDDDLLDEVRKGVMLQRDYTKKRQEEASRLQRLEAAVSQMAQQRHPAQAPSDPVEEFLAQHDDGTESSQQIRQLLHRFAAAMEQRNVARLAPIQTAVGVRVADDRIDDYARQELVPKYGEGIKALLDKARPVIRQRLLSGSNADPMAIMMEVDPDGTTDFLTRHRSRQARRATSRHMDGLTEVGHREPPFNVPKDNSNNNTRERGLRGYAAVDTAEIAKSFDNLLRSR